VTRSDSAHFDWNGYERHLAAGGAPFGGEFNATIAEAVDSYRAVIARTEAENRRLRDLVDRAVYPVTAALNCTAHPWHGSDEARRWLMEAAK
jgi:hypothetical protein